MTAFNCGTGCKVPFSDGWCAAVDNCVEACQLDVGLSDQIARSAAEWREAAEYWCALCPTSHPTRAALDKHTAELHPTSIIGTSARLQQTQQALAASQADLTRAERERDEVKALFAEMHETSTQSHMTTVSQLWQAEQQRDLARAELATATAELEQLRAQLNPQTEETPHA